jgi:hypothetical protein
VLDVGALDEFVHAVSRLHVACPLPAAWKRWPRPWGFGGMMRVGAGSFRGERASRFLDCVNGEGQVGPWSYLEARIRRSMTMLMANMQQH